MSTHKLPAVVLALGLVSSAAYSVGPNLGTQVEPADIASWDIRIQPDGTRLPIGAAVHPADEMTDRDERFLAAEYIREKIFRLLGQEVPYATSVAIDSFEHEGGLRSIHATVYVDKTSQRAMLLGVRGERMKSIAASARRDMEQLFGGKVFLEVWVKVKSGWATDERMLDQFGY